MTLGVSGSWRAVLVAALCVPATAGAATVPRPPMSLPSAGASAASGGDWLIGARPGAATLRIARAHGARALDARGASLTIPRARARALAAALRRAGRLAYAEPDVAVHPADATAEDPRAWARGAIVAPSLLAPEPGGGAAVAIVDEPVDATVPDLAGHVTFLDRRAPPPVWGFHGTAVASVVSAALNGSGVLGVFPGERMFAYALPRTATCASVVRGIEAAVAARARVVNLSLIADGVCYSLFAAVERAFAHDVLTIAAVGNGRRSGSPMRWPAAFPHVIGIGAVGPDFTAAAFSSANSTVDLVAPGVGVPVALPLAFDLDGEPDGVSFASGTSFAAPAVAGVAGWLRSRRPELRVDQVAAMLRGGAIDLGRPGWNRDTGFGLVNVIRTLGFPTPATDLREPNDDIPFVDATALGRPAHALWQGGRGYWVRSSVDQLDDPVDVYRLRIPAHAAAEIRLRPDHGDPDLEVYDASTLHVGQARHRIAASRLPGQRTDRLVVVNRRPWRVTAYAAVSIDPVVRGLHATYTLTVSAPRARAARRATRAGARSRP